MSKSDYQNLGFLYRAWRRVIPSTNLLRNILLSVLFLLSCMCFISVWQFMIHGEVLQNIVTGGDANLDRLLDNQWNLLLISLGFSLSVPFLLAFGFMLFLIGLRLLITGRYMSLGQFFIQIVMLSLLFLLSGVIYYQYPLLGGYFPHNLISRFLSMESIPVISHYTLISSDLISFMSFVTSVVMYIALLTDICLGSLNVSWSYRARIWIYIPRMFLEFVYFVLIIIHKFLSLFMPSKPATSDSSSKPVREHTTYRYSYNKSSNIDRPMDPSSESDGYGESHSESSSVEKESASEGASQNSPRIPYIPSIFRPSYAKQADAVKQSNTNEQASTETKTSHEDVYVGSKDTYENQNPVSNATKTAHTGDYARDYASGNTGSMVSEKYDNFKIPSLSLLNSAETNQNTDTEEELHVLSEKLKKVLSDFNIQGDILGVNTGPVVNLFEFQPAPGTKTSKIIALERDIARSLEVTSARVAIVKGKNAVGIELPNGCRQTIYLQELLSKADFSNKQNIDLALGKGIDGKPYFSDLCKMPHLLLAGTTGSGKSAAINTMLLSILFRLSPAQCRLILIDPKMLELALYNDIPHLLIPVVVDPKQAVLALQWVVREMERRYMRMSQIHARDIISYNQKLEHMDSHETTSFGDDHGKAPVKMPYIVVVIDELADLMLVAGREIESAIQRLSQMARAAGIHLIVATQRPSVDVITGTIKANFPTRISFQVSSKIDSRTVLGDTGAEQLLGAGDMLYMAGAGRITRLHGSFVTEQEVERVNDFLRKNYKVQYVQDVTAAMDSEQGQKSNQEVDELYDRAVELIKSQGRCSTSMLQRHFQIGYNRAARIMDNLEDSGVVSSADHTGKRHIL